MNKNTTIITEPFQPIWYKELHACVEDYKLGNVLVASDMNDEGAKKFALFPNYTELINYRDSRIPERRNLYEITKYDKNTFPHYPTKLF